MVVTEDLTRDPVDSGERVVLFRNTKLEISGYLVTEKTPERGGNASFFLRFHGSWRGRFHVSAGFGGNCCSIIMALNRKV